MQTKEQTKIPGSLGHPIGHEEPSHASESSPFLFSVGLASSPYPFLPNVRLVVTIPSPAHRAFPPADCRNFFFSSFFLVSAFIYPTVRARAQALCTKYVGICRGFDEQGKWRVVTVLLGSRSHLPFPSVTTAQLLPYVIPYRYATQLHAAELARYLLYSRLSDPRSSSVAHAYLPHPYLTPP